VIKFIEVNDLSVLSIGEYKEIEVVIERYEAWMRPT